MTVSRLDIHVRLTPNASRDELLPYSENAAGQRYLTARVRAVPEKGRANKALIALLAKALRVARSQLALVRGATSRLKTVRIEADRDTCNRVTKLLESIGDERSTD